MGNDKDEQEGTADNDDVINEETNKHDDTESKNLYLEPPRTAVTEWMGRKAAKTWSTSYVQPVFAEQMIQQVQRSSIKNQSLQYNRRNLMRGGVCR